jgi:hypothetical protein
MRPVAVEFMERHAQSVHAVLELLDHVLLIATLIRARHHLSRRQILARRDRSSGISSSRTASRLILLMFLQQGHDAIGPAALPRLVAELGHVFVMQCQLEAATLLDDPLLFVRLGTVARRARKRLVLRPSLQPLRVRSGSGARLRRAALQSMPKTKSPVSDHRSK